MPTKNALIFGHKRGTSCASASTFSNETLEDHLYYDNDHLEEAIGIVPKYVLIILVHTSRVSIRSYNLRESFTEKCYEEIVSLLEWQMLRQRILGMTLLSKMGGILVDLHAKGLGNKKPAVDVQSTLSCLIDNAVESLPLSLTTTKNVEALMDFVFGVTEHFTTCSKARITHDYPFSNEKNYDCVYRHFRPFLISYNAHISIDEQSSKSCQEESIMIEMLRLRNNEFMQKISRSLRLVHWSRCPILFTQLRDWLFKPSGNTFICSFSRLQVPQIYISGDSENMNFISLELVGWYDLMMKDLTTSYIDYLKTLGMRPIENEKNPATKDNPADSSVVYLLKPFQAGAIMCEFGMRGMFFLINLYILDGVYCAKQLLLDNTLSSERREYFKALTEECANLKNLIHPNCEFSSHCFV
jgi:hypothetical protein